MSGVIVGRLQLAHRVLNASGTLDAVAAHEVLGDATLGAAAHVTKTVTLHARDGNPAPRLARTSGGLLNSVGLQNAGLEAVAGDVLARVAAVCDVPIVVSVGGFSPDEYAAVVGALDAVPGVAGFELNVSCPNVHSGCSAIGADPAETFAVTSGCRSRTDRPLWVKLSPGVPDLAPIAQAAEAAGADALTLVNTVRGAALDVRSGLPALATRTGGLSGPPVRPVAVAAVLVCREAVSIDLVGVGGVAAPGHARDLLAAGAAAVGVGTASFRDPGTIRRVRAGLADVGEARRAAPAPGETTRKYPAKAST